MESRTSPRQTAIRMLAQEYSDASLTEMGTGEFDPSFVITKLGARGKQGSCGGGDRQIGKKGWR